MQCSIDTGIFCFINKSLMNPFFDFIMPLITMLGSGEAAFFIAIIVILLNIRKKEKRMAGVLMLAGLSPVYYIVSYIKDWVSRPRPFISIENVHIIGNHGGFSFPSGHATIAFMTAAILSQYFKRPAVFYSIAAMVAISRLYVGAHYFTDVLAGAVLGFVIARILVKIVFI